jgi:hypothetical protein
MFLNLYLQNEKTSQEKQKRTFFGFIYNLRNTKHRSRTTGKQKSREKQKAEKQRRRDA